MVALPSVLSGLGWVANMLCIALVPVVQVLMPPVRGDWFARASHAGGFLTPRASIWNFGARRAGRRKQYRRGGRFKGGKSRRSCLMGTHPEKKFLDGTFTTAPTVAGAVGGSSMLDIAQGASDSNRVGRKAILTDILLKGNIATAVASGASPNGSNRIRIDVVHDTQPNKLTFASTDYLESGDINSYKKLINAKRFRTLYSHVWTINALSGGGDGTTNWIAGKMVPVNINIKCCIDLEFDEAVGTSGTIDERTLNNVMIVVWEEATGPATSVNLLTRIRFVE